MSRYSGEPRGKFYTVILSTGAAPSPASPGDCRGLSGAGAFFGMVDKNKP